MNDIYFLGLWLIDWNETLQPMNILKYIVIAVGILGGRLRLDWQAGAGIGAFIWGLWKAMPTDDLHDTADATGGILALICGLLVLHDSVRRHYPNMLNRSSTPQK